jgi:S-adenosylmethionine synthetase
MLEGLVGGFFSRYPQYHIEALHINPAGEWSIGGFTADAGLTGRKLAVDNYGPRVPLGGGAFSGKDCTKVDRSAAYMARRVAVDILEQRPEVQEVMVQLAYAIGYDQPLQATAIVDGEHEFIKGYDLSPKGIIDFLELRNPIFGRTAGFGHMGAGFNWK